MYMYMYMVISSGQFLPLLRQHQLVQPGESLAIDLLARDQVNNSREAVWSLEAPNQEVVSSSLLLGPVQLLTIAH